MVINCYSTFTKLQERSLTIRYNLVSYEGHNAIKKYIKLRNFFAKFWSGHFCHGCESDELHWPVKAQACNILSENRSLDLSVWLGTHLQNPQF